MNGPDTRATSGSFGAVGIASIVLLVVGGGLLIVGGLKLRATRGQHMA
jgi:hypothetical protein